jgi:cytoskeletal protein RodZ
MESIGRYLRTEREVRQISLEELAQTTRIPLRHLASLEDDRLDRLPGDVFVRGFLKSYAKAVGLGTEDVLRRYEGQSRSSGIPTEVSAAPIAGIAGPERGRRFGLAIALVVILILFTLALSIALRPRHRETPVQLSSVPAAVLATGLASA